MTENTVPVHKVYDEDMRKSMERTRRNWYKFWQILRLIIVQHNNIIIINYNGKAERRIRRWNGDGYWEASNKGQDSEKEEADCKTEESWEQIINDWREEEKPRPSKRLNPKTSQENKPEEKIKRPNVKAIDFFQGRKKSSLKISCTQKRAKKTKSFAKKSIKQLIQEMRKLLE